MKTKLPEQINSTGEAMNFLSTLHAHREAFNPDDDAHELDWIAMDDDEPKPTREQCDTLNILMAQIYGLNSKSGQNGKYDYPLKFDAHEFMMNLNAGIIKLNGQPYVLGTECISLGLNLSMQKIITTVKIFREDDGSLTIAAGGGVYIGVKWEDINDYYTDTQENRQLLRDKIKSGK